MLAKLLTLVAVSSRTAKELRVAFGETCSAIPDKSSAKIVQEGIESLYEISKDKLAWEMDAPEKGQSRYRSICLDILAEINAPCDDDVSTNYLNSATLSEDDTSVFWPIGYKFYPRAMHTVEHDCRLHIQYNNGDVEGLDIIKELWKFNTAVRATSSLMNNYLQATSIENTVLKALLELFANKALQRHHAQGSD